MKHYTCDVCQRDVDEDELACLAEDEAGSERMIMLPPQSPVTAVKLAGDGKDVCESCAAIAITSFFETLKNQFEKKREKDA